MHLLHDKHTEIRYKNPFHMMIRFNNPFHLMIRYNNPFHMMNNNHILHNEELDDLGVSNENPHPVIPGDGH